MVRLDGGNAASTANRLHRLIPALLTAVTMDPAVAVLLSISFRKGRALMKMMQWMRFLCAGFALSAMAVEVPVSHQPAQEAAPRNQYDAVAASNGDQYLVVWGDDRAGVPQTYATRVSREGTVLDPNGFRVASGDLTIVRLAGSVLTSGVRVVWGGKSWFVLSAPCGGVALVRVGADGAVMDARPRHYSYGSDCGDLSVASDGRHVVVGYVNGFQPIVKQALFLDSDGEPVALVILGDGYESPVIASSGSSFVAVWKDRAVRFDVNGILDSRSVSFAGPREGAMSIASDGTDMLVVHGNQAFRLSADLVVEPLGVLPFSYVKSTARTGSGYVVAGIIPTTLNQRYHEGNGSIVHIDDGGRLLAQREVRTQGTARGFVVASNGENVLLPWHDPTEAQLVSPPPHSDVFLSVVSLPDLTPGPRKLLAVSADAQLRPATATSGRNLLTVWKEATGIYARRHWRDGSADGPPIRLTGDATSMDVVFNGTDFIVATTEGSAVVTRLLPATGELRVHRTWRLEGQDPGAIALANSGGVTLAAWLGRGVRATLVAADGSLIDDPLDIAPEPHAREAHRIAVSPNGAGEFLVVWGGSTPECVCSPPVLPSRSGVLRAARVTSTLTLLDRPAIEITSPVGADDPRANPTGPQYDALHSLKADHPSAVWNGKEWLVVWSRGFRNASGEVREEIRGRRIAPNGTLLDGSADDAGVLIASDGFAPTIAWTGSRYVLAWYEAMLVYVSGSRERVHPIRTALLENLGGTLSNERTLGESAARDPVSIAVANGFTALAYSRLGDDKVYGGVSRAFLDVPVPAPRRRAVRK